MGLRIHSNIEYSMTDQAEKLTTFELMPQLPEPYASCALQAERDALAMVMLDQGRGLELLDPSWFTTRAHLMIYEAAIKLVAEGAPTDVVTLSEEIDNQGLLPAVGGIAYLGKMAATAKHVRLVSIAPVLKGFAHMRSGMGDRIGPKVVLPLMTAIENGYLHGRSWLLTRGQLQSLNAPYLGDLSTLAKSNFERVCYAYRNPPIPDPSLTEIPA